MPPFHDLEETQRLDDGDGDGDGDSDGDDSHSSGNPIDEDYYDDYRGGTVPLGETLAVETERQMDDSILYGETQAVDEGDDENGIDDWIETQIVGDGEGEIGDEGVEGTEVDDDAGARVLGDGVDSDASTDDEGTSKAGEYVSSELPLSGDSCKSNNGSARSIAAVRAASLRSSGLAAAQSITSKALNIELQSSFSNGENHNNQVNGAGLTGANGLVTWPDSTADRTVLGNEGGGTVRDRETKNSRKCTEDYHRDESKSRTNNPVVKKLLYELTSAEEETTCKPNSTTGQVDSPGSLDPDSNIAGLSYVESQEPGDFSQANALDVVDKFLVVNDLGLSQEANTGNSKDMVKSPAISSAKGAQVLAKKTDYRSPVGKTGTFEWIDSLEDEGGGEFFTKRRDSFFERKDGARKSRSQPPKSRHVSFGPARKADIGDRDANPNIHQKIKSLTCSDSRLMQNTSLINEKARVVETRTKKNLFKDLNEQSNSKSLDQELEETDVEIGKEGVQEFGPDTQMAAEAMEALVCGSPMNNEMNDVHPAAGKLTKIRSEGVTKRTTTSKSAISRKSTSSTPNLKGVSTRSKQRKMISTDSKQETPICSRKNSKGKRSLDCTTEGMKSKRGRKKLERDLNARSLVSENECSVSFNGKKVLGQVERASTNGADECSNSLTLNVQFSVGKELIQSEFCVNSTPIAQRTRHSKASRLSEKAEEIATDCGKDANVTVSARTRGTIAREDKLVTDTGGSCKTKRKCSDVGLVQNAEVERNFMSHTKAQDIEDLQEKQARAGSPVKTSLTHPKRRRTRQNTAKNPNINDNLKNCSLLKDSIQPRTCQRNIRATVKSISQILDTAKRKKRSVSTHMESEIDGSTSDGRKAVFVSGVRTRSSIKFSSENASLNCFSRTVIHTAGSANMANPCSTPSLKQGADFNCQVEVAEGNSKPEKEKIHPAVLACTTPLKDVDAVSPVCVAQDHPRAQGNKGRSRSLIARELIRLEANNSSPTFGFNTRRRKDMSNVHVLFSHHLDADIVKQQKKIIGRLGVPLVPSISDATHFVTDNFVRTKNMLEAMALGKPVVTHMWLESCGQASCFIDERNYILRDAKKEREIGFSMPVSLARACQNPLLQGIRVYITPNTKPSMEVISSLVKAANGQPMERIGRSALKDDKIPDDLLVLSCEEDYSLCIPLLEKGAEIFSSELLLNGIVIQKLEYDRHRLFLDHVKRTRSTLWLRREDGSQFLPITKCT